MAGPLGIKKKYPAAMAMMMTAAIMATKSFLDTGMLSPSVTLMKIVLINITSKFQRGAW